MHALAIAFPKRFSENENSSSQKIKKKIKVSNERYGSLKAKRNIPYEPFHCLEKIDQTSSDPPDRLIVPKPMSRIY